jgi:Mn-containing catalase
VGLSGFVLMSTDFRAEKKNKQILESINDASDHLQIVSGQLKCHICGEDDFESHADALEHIKKEHNTGDFEGSDSDASVQEDESSETEESSGDDSSDFEGSDEEYESDEDGKPKRRSKNKTSTTEPQELKNGRNLIADYADEIRFKNIATRSIQWTKEQ